MLHKNRSWVVTTVESDASLVQKLVQHTWTGCTAFELHGYLFANDSTCGDGAQEYAVLHTSVDGDSFTEIESITFSWCSERRALDLIHQVCSGDFDGANFCRVERERIQTPKLHGYCYLCR